MMFFCIFFSLESSYKHKKATGAITRQRPLFLVLSSYFFPLTSYFLHLLITMP